MSTGEGAGARAAPWLQAWIVFCVLGGLALRVLGARNDLWQDEIWTFSLLRTISSPLGIFVDLSADNNHFLNTLYLYYIGPDASPLAQRAFSILLGTATIVAVGLLLRRAHWIACGLGVALFAFGYPLVHYGSEARGYAGFLLCSVISIGLVQRELEAPERRNRIWLGISNVLGTLFQPIMLGTVVVLIAWVAWHHWRHGATLRLALARAQSTFSVTIRLLLVAVILAVVAIYRVGAYKILAAAPFTPAAIVYGYGGMLRFLLGVPQAVPEWIVLAATLPAAAAALVLWRDRIGPRAGFYTLAIFGLPAALFCARLPNLGINRYYLLPSLGLLLLLIELFTLCWRDGGWRRSIALLLCALFAFGNALELAAFYKYGRGQYQTVVRMIAESASPRVASNLDGATSVTLEYHAERLHLPLRFIDNDAFCGAGATWFIQVAALPQPDEISVGGPACPKPFRKVADYPISGLSGWPWTLYRAE